VIHESSKRVGIKMTEVALAFPIASGRPIIQPQNVYNLLSIRKTNFFISAMVLDLSNELEYLLTPQSFSFKLTSFWLQTVKTWTTRMQNGILCF